MSNKKTLKFDAPSVLCIAIALCISLTACSREEQETAIPSSGKLVIKNSGSDTMVVLAQAWAEEYAKINPSVSVEVCGGGSGAGIAALISGTADIANSTRAMITKEIAMAKKNTGKEPQEYVVGYDGIAFYVHKDNPLNKITIWQLAEIFGEGGTITKWSQLGFRHPACPTDDIIRVSRQSSSGTYYYLREVLLGKHRDFKLGSRDLHGSKDVVELVAMTPCAIGYCGMRYATPHVKKLKLAKKANSPAYEPSVATVLNGTYPIARPLYIYSLGQPTGETRKYLEWIHSDTAQNIARINGYVPLPEAERRMRKSSMESTQ